MHHTNPKPPRALWTLLLGLALGGPCLAQPPGDTKAAAVRTLNVPLNATQRVQMSNPKLRIKSVDNPRGEIARAVADNTDPTSVLVTALAAGTTRLTLTAENDLREDVLVNVQQFDVEYLRGIYRQTIPTSNIIPVPSANNTLILTGHVARAEDVDLAQQVTRSVVGQNVLSALRVGGVMQVQLEVCVAQVSRSEARRMSFEFVNFGQKHVLANAMGGLTIPSTGIAGSFPGAPTITNAISPVAGAPINGFFAIFDPEQDFFGFLQALRDENLVKLQSFPKVVVMSGRQVSFLSGGEQAIPVPAGLGQVGVQFEEFGTRLNALPIVMGNGKIHLELEPEVSSLNAAFGTSIGGTVVPGRTTQRLRTTVELETGQTLCIGGLIQNNVTGSTRKVPILGDLPFIGAAFSQKFYNEDEAELVILVTPRLVDPMSCDQLPKCLPGQETRTPDDFELFLEGILEAPRGPRDVFPNQRYRAAYLNSPSAGVFPCAGNGGACGHGACGHGNCKAHGTCATPGLGGTPANVGGYQSGQVLPAGLTEARPARGEIKAAPAAVLPPADMAPALPTVSGEGPTPAAGETAPPPALPAGTGSSGLR